MNGYVVGLAGHAGAGKDEVARIIAELRPDWIVRRDAFADRLKVSAARALGYSCSDQEAIEIMNHIKECGWIETDSRDYATKVCGRTFLQLYGTEAHRDVFGEDFWVDQVLPNSCAGFFGREDAFDLLVVTDVRFPNEVARGLVWLVDRPSVTPKDGDPDHRSSVIPDHDLVVDNSGDLDHLRDEVRVALTAGL